MSLNINLKKQLTSNSLEPNPFDYFPPELTFEIAKKLSEKDLRTLMLVSKYFRNIATDNFIWKPILECLSNKTKENLSSYLQTNQIHRILSSKAERPMSFLRPAELIWHSGKHVVVAAPKKSEHESFNIQIYNYDAERLYEYELPPTQLIHGHNDFIFVTHPAEKGVHIYELVSGEKIGVLADNFKSIDHITIIDNALTIEGKVEEKKEKKKTKEVKIVEKKYSRTWEISKEIINCRPNRTKKHKCHLVLNDKTNEIEVKKGEKVIKTISKWQYTGLDGYKPIQVKKDPKRDVYIATFQLDHITLKSLPEKVLKSLPPTTHLKLLTCSPSGTIYKEFSFRFKYLHKEQNKLKNQKRIIKINQPKFKAEINNKNPIRINKNRILIKSLPIEDYTAIAVLTHSSEDQFIFALQSLKDKHEFKVLTTTSNGTLVSEHFFHLTNIAKTFWVSLGNDVLVVSDLEKIKRLDLRKPSKKKHNPVKIHGSSLQRHTFTACANYIKNMSVIDYNLVLHGYILNFFTDRHINNASALEADIKILQPKQFVRIIKLLDSVPPKQSKILSLILSSFKNNFAPFLGPF